MVTSILNAVVNVVNECKKFICTQSFVNGLRLMGAFHLVILFDI